MKSGFYPVFGLAVMSLAMSGGTARALDLNPFSAYSSNISRLSAANDAVGVQRQITDGGNPNQVDDNNRAGLHSAAMNGNLQIIAILIKAGAQINMKDNLGNTPLHYAAERDHLDALNLLLGVGAAVDPGNKDGMTPLMVAASHGETTIMQALLAKGANPKKSDYTGRDALSWAQEAHRPAAVEALRRAGKGS
jgi:ankyrin repeat protein